MSDLVLSVVLGVLFPVWVLAFLYSFYRWLDEVYP